MGENKESDLKMKALREEGALNHRATHVKERLFHDDDFFDPRDLIQVKYEMLRKVKTDGWTVSRAAATFGLSRFSYYKARSAFERKGIPGLIAKKPGPRGGYKITQEIMEAIEEMSTQDPKIKPMEVKKEVKDRFGVQVHRRSIDRSLTRIKKKTKMNTPPFSSLPHTMLTNRYEALRSARLGYARNNPECAVLSSRGMVAWMKAICDDTKRVYLTPNLPTYLDTSPPSEQVIQNCVYHQVIEVLTTIVIAHY